MQAGLALHVHDDHIIREIRHATDSIVITSLWGPGSMPGPNSRLCAGAAAKQSTILHITLGRVLEPRHLTRKEVAAVQQACQRWTEQLRGQPFTPASLWWVWDLGYRKGASMCQLPAMKALFVHAPGRASTLTTRRWLRGVLPGSVCQQRSQGAVCLPALWAPAAGLFSVPGQLCQCHCWGWWCVPCEQWFKAPGSLLN